MTNNGVVTYRTTHDRLAAEDLAAWLNTPEGIKQLHAEIAAKPEYAGVELIHTTPAEVVEIPDEATLAAATRLRGLGHYLSRYVTASRPTSAQSTTGGRPWAFVAQRGGRCCL